MQGADHGGDGTRGEVSQGGEGVDLDGLAVGVEGGVEQAGVDGRDDEVLEGAGRREVEGGLEGSVGQVRSVAGEVQEGELAELECLGVVELRQLLT